MEYKAILVLERDVVKEIASKVKGETNKRLAYGVLLEETEALGGAIMAKLFERIIKEPMPSKDLQLTLTAEYLS